MSTPRGRPTITLRLLLLSLLIASAPLAWLASAAHRQRSAVKALEEVGASVGYDFEYDDGLNTPDWVKGRVVPKWARDLFGVDLCCNVVQLDLAAEGVDFYDRAMPNVLKLTRLRSLQLACAEITDADVVALSSLSTVEYLTIESEQVTDASLAALCRIASLKFLSLENTSISDAGDLRLRAALPHVVICSKWRQPSNSLMNP